MIVAREIRFKPMDNTPDAVKELLEKPKKGIGVIGMKIL